MAEQSDPFRDINVYSRRAVHGPDSTILAKYNLTYYPGNNTLSNTTVCYYYVQSGSSTDDISLSPSNDTSPVAFPQCTDPVLSLGLHGILGITFGCLFLTALVLSLVNMRSQAGHSHDDRRRRRKWCALGLVAAVVGALAGLVAIDVGRDALVGLSFEVQGVFYAALAPLVAGFVFEFTRWQEMWVEEEKGRGRRGALWNKWSIWAFYIGDVAGFILLVARNWEAIKMQWYSEQAMLLAKPVGTGPRFVVGNLLILVCLGLSCVNLVITWNARGAVTGTGARFNPERVIFVSALATLLCFIPVIYGCASSIHWDISPYNKTTTSAWFYGTGLAPVLLCLFLLNSLELSEYGLTQTLAQPATRGIGGAPRPNVLRRHTKKPRWWHNSSSQPHPNDREALEMSNLKEIRGRQEKFEDDTPLLPQQGDEGENLIDKQRERMRQELLRDDAEGEVQGAATTTGDVDSTSANANVVPHLDLQAEDEHRPSQKVYSMLDV